MIFMASSDDHDSDRISAFSDGDSSYEDMVVAGLFEEELSNYAWHKRFNRRRIDWDYHVEKLVHENQFRRTYRMSFVAFTIS